MSNDNDTAHAVIASLHRIEALLHTLLYVIRHEGEEGEEGEPLPTLDGESMGRERQPDQPL